MVAPTLPQPASRGLGPPTFEFDTSETRTSPDYASVFRGLDAVASLGVDLSSAAALQAREVPASYLFLPEGL